MIYFLLYTYFFLDTMKVTIYFQLIHMGSFGIISDILFFDFS